MRLIQPLDDLFQTRSHVKVLRALAGVPEGVDMSIREVARRAGVSHPTASSVLESLRNQGIVHARRTFWADEYRVNPEHILWQRMRSILKWEHRVRDGFLGFLRDEVSERAPWVTAAWLFGSASREDMLPNSDIDIALICPKNRVAGTKKAMEPLADLTQDRFGNRVSAVVGSRPITELAEPGQPGYRLWRRIAREGIRFIPVEGE